MPVNNLSNATAFCRDAACTQTQPISSLNQLRAPAGAFRRFLWPGDDGGNSTRGPIWSVVRVLG
jgi:hypothetical protein